MAKKALRCRSCKRKHDTEVGRKKRVAKKLSMPRTCADCPADIRHMDAKALRCAACALVHDRASVRSWYRANREYWLSKVQAYSVANKMRLKDWQLKKNYGITLADFDAMYAAQEGKCACCGISKPSRGKSGLHVDHCHTTGKVRGLLCSTCNRLEGVLDKHPEQYHAVMDYHARHCGTPNCSPSALPRKLVQKYSIVAC